MVSVYFPSKLIEEKFCDRLQNDTIPKVIFLPEYYRNLSKNNASLCGFSPTPIHGRTCFVTFDDGQLWAIKGVGWSFGPPYFLQSPKDAQLYFGLYDKRDSERELAVSNWLFEHDIRSARVAGFVEIPCEWVERISNGKPLTFRDGTPLIPVQQYTKTITPYRVADLTYCNDTRKLALIKETAALCGWPEDINSFVHSFTLQLIDTVLQYHALDCANDSLSWDNCTLAAEPIDYEWFSVPNIILPDGTDPTIRLIERQQKELIYIGEISIQLAALLETSITMLSIFEIIQTMLIHQYPNRIHLYKNFFETAFSHVV
jgi:hypothetical protein